MPIYEFVCSDASCQKDHPPLEKIRKMIEADDLVECPRCGQPMKRKVSVSNFTLKGGGWAADGYAGGS